MFKDAEFTLVQREFKPVLKVLVRVKPCFFVLFFGRYGSRLHLAILPLHEEALNVRPMKGLQVSILPVKFEE